MTREQWGKLSKGKQRAKIATLCGWVDCVGGRGFTPDGNHRNIEKRQHRRQERHTARFMLKQGMGDELSNRKPAHINSISKGLLA